MKRSFFILLSIFCWHTAFAQDVHLSQFYTNQQNLNPALAGDYDGRYQVTSNYRNQWPQIGTSPIVTSMIGFDRKIYFNSDEIAAGILVLRDQFSDFGQNTDKILLTASYAKSLYGHQLRGGLQMGFVMKNTDLSGQSFPNQWVYEEGEFNTGVSNQESNILESQNFFDLNLGFSWSKKYQRIQPKAGFTVFHLNRPSDSYFSEEQAQLPIRYLLHASAVYQWKSTLSFEPQLMYMRSNKALDMMLGGSLRKDLQNMGKLNALKAGLLYRGGFGRNSDALIPVIGAIYKYVEVGLSYDYNVSDLSDFGAQKSTFEISLIYTAPQFLPSKMALPCDRF